MSVRKRRWTTRLGEQKESFIVDYTDQDGDRHIRTFQRKKDADAYHATVTVDVHKGLHTAPSKSITVAEAAENWIKRVDAEGRERTTVRQYRQHVDLHIAPRIGGVKLAQLNSARVETFRDELVKALSKPLARKVLTSLKSLLKVAKYSHVAADVSIGAGQRKRKLESGRDIPTPAEVGRLIKAATDIRRQTLLLVVAMTGLRASELRGLRWVDIDMKLGELHVRQRADRYCEIGVTKSVAGQRTISLAPELLVALKEWKLACPKGEKGLVFPSVSGGVEHHANLLRSLSPIMIDAGVVDKHGEPKYALHAFRHFFASWCINPKDRGGRGLPPKVVQELMGHASIVITLDTYGHLFPRGDDRDELAAAAKALLVDAT
jgi:integrase